MNCFEPSISVLTPYKGHRDFFKLHFFACNYVGFSLHLLGYGINAQVRIYNPDIRSDE